MCPSLLNRNTRHWYTSPSHKGELPAVKAVACSDVGCYELDCTKAKSQRRKLTINDQPYYEAMQTARARQQTKEFKEPYNTRAGIEGMISQGVRAVDLRYARNRGLAKTKLQHFATAAGINLLRLRDGWFEQPKRQHAFSHFLHWYRNRDEFFKSN